MVNQKRSGSDGRPLKTPGVERRQTRDYDRDQRGGQDGGGSHKCRTRFLETVAPWRLF